MNVKNYYLDRGDSLPFPATMPGPILDDGPKLVERAPEIEAGSLGWKPRAHPIYQTRLGACRLYQFDHLRSGGVELNNKHHCY